MSASPMSNDMAFAPADPSRIASQSSASATRTAEYGARAREVTSRGRSRSTSGIGEAGSVEAATDWSDHKLTVVDHPNGAIQIEAGSAFGHGRHPTTDLALRAIVDLGEGGGRTLLDVGTGTGVLSLAAARQGFVATGCDIHGDIRTVVEQMRCSRHGTANGRSDIHVERCSANSAHVDICVSEWSDIAEIQLAHARDVGG